MKGEAELSCASKNKEPLYGTLDHNEIDEQRRAQYGLRHIGSNKADIEVPGNHGNPRTMVETSLSRISSSMGSKLSKSIFVRMVQLD